MYTYTILAPSTPMLWGKANRSTHGTKEKITWPGKVCGRYPFDTFEGVAHCAWSILQGKSAGCVLRPGERNSIKCQDSFKTSSGIHFVEGKGSMCLPATWVLFWTSDPIWEHGHVHTHVFVFTWDLMGGFSFLYEKALLHSLYVGRAREMQKSPFSVSRSHEKTNTLYYPKWQSP